MFKFLMFFHEWLTFYAVPAGTFQTFQAVGNREDLEDVIYDISPTETPFFTRCKKVKATATFHE